MMKLRGIFLLALILFAAPAMAQVNPGTSPLSIPKGGTGGATAAAARTSLGLGSIATQNANAVAITGGTVTGLPTPSVAADAANKSYVDGIAAGISTLSASRLATTAVLPNTPTYANGTAGVGATLTAGANSTLTVDGTLANLNDVVLVKNQATAFQNGIYTVTTAGGGVPWVLTRASYFNTAAQMKAGSYTFITAGATLTSNSFVLAAAVTTVGTDPLNFNLFTYFGGVASIDGKTGGFITGNGLDSTSGNVVELSAVRRTLPTSQNFLSGTGTYTTPANVIWIEVRMVGGGGGGGAATSGGTGGTTTFGSSLLVANGGAGGLNGGGNGGTGGASALGSGPIGIALTGGSGAPVIYTGAPSTFSTGGSGGASAFGGAGSGGYGGQYGQAGVTNTGGGGGGGSTTLSYGYAGGSGGGSGGFISAIINSPSATYGYAVGAGGSAGLNGPNNYGGGIGGSGGIWVIEHYGS